MVILFPQAVNKKEMERTDVVGKKRQKQENKLLFASGASAGFPMGPSATVKGGKSAAVPFRPQ
jgi:hypothetical protein